MAAETSFLQSIKLEISRTFKLAPYERIAFHKILGIKKTDTSMNILLKELEKGPDIRSSAIATLVHFNHSGILEKLVPLLKEKISTDDTLYILDFIQRMGDQNNIPNVLELIRKHQDSPQSVNILKKSFVVLQKIGKGSESTFEYLKNSITDEEANQYILPFAIKALATFRDISIFEAILKGSNESAIGETYNAIYSLSVDVANETHSQKTKEEQALYTYTEVEDKIILDIRVLLGKMTSKFDSYPNNTKVSFISAMIACHHREFLIYVMKALTSKNSALISMTLYTLYANITKLRDPDKLFRNLIAISTETERNSELIVEIFKKYFFTPQQTRQFNILRDKLYSYIVVTLETYFETYRKEFMVTNVIEKSFPESFQNIRKFVLERLTPGLKKKITHYLVNEEPALIKHIIGDISKWVTYLNKKDESDLAILIEILFDNDKKSRANSASRIEDINFEKRYLRNRIIRICVLIETLKINEAATSLVKIYNYLKKYPDPKLVDAVIHTLSVLNYSYMLGEIEIMLSTGTQQDQKNALQYLSLYNEQRSLNIILDQLQSKTTKDSEITIELIKILLERDIEGNVTASELFKKIIASNTNKEIIKLSILGIGKTGFDHDIAYLNDLFFKQGMDDPKDAIVRATGYIININKNYNKRILIKNLYEYLKDPGIKVRIYSCLLLLHLGTKEAFKSIRDMLLIKNKSIQRDILTIIGNLRSIEFSFFLLSLLKEEYAISQDIIPVIQMLPDEELNEIDGFVVNLFRKFEAPDIEGMELQYEKKEISIDGLREENVIILDIGIHTDKSTKTTDSISTALDRNLKLKELTSSVIDKHNGTITKMSNTHIMAYFKEPQEATEAGCIISQNFIEYNNVRPREKQLYAHIQLLALPVKIFNNELIQPPTYRLVPYSTLPLSHKVLSDDSNMCHVKKNYTANVIPEVVFYKTHYTQEQFDIINMINFSSIAENIIQKILIEEEKQQELQKQIDAELKRMKLDNRPKSAASIAGELEDIANKLKLQLDEIERYVNKRSTDRELIKNVRKMLTNVYNLYKVEISRIIIE